MESEREREMRGRNVRENVEEMWEEREGDEREGRGVWERV